MPALTDSFSTGIAGIATLVILLLSFADASQFGAVGSPRMFYDHIRNRILLTGGGNQVVYTLNPSTLSLSRIAGSVNTSGSQTGTSSLLYNPADITLDHDMNAYLITDTSNRCVRRLPASPPYSMTTFIGLCGTGGSTRGSAANTRFDAIKGIDRGVVNGRIVHVLVDFFGGLIELHDNTTRDLTLDLVNPRALAFVNNLKVNGSLLKVNGSREEQVRDIIVIADNQLRLSYYHGGKLERWMSFTGSGSVSSIKMYGRTLFVTLKGNSTTGLFTFNLDTDNGFKRTTCTGRASDLWDILLLPNGTLIQSVETGFGQYVIACSPGTYDPSSLNVTQLTLTESTSSTQTPTGSSTATRSGSHSSTSTPTVSSTTTSTVSTSRTQTHSRSSSETRSGSLSNSRSASASITKPPAVTPSSMGTRSASISRTVTSTRTRVQRRRRTATAYRQRSSTPMQPAPDIEIVDLSTPVKAFSVLFSANAVKTSSVLMVMSGQCGAIREFEFYEDPFSTRFVVFTDIALIIAVGLVMTAGACVIDRIRGSPSTRARLRTIVVQYKVVDTVVFLWMLFMPAIITAFFKYGGILEILFGVVYIIATTVLMLCSSWKARPAKVNDEAGLFGEEYGWSGHELIVPVVEGYKSVRAVFIDFLFLFLTSASTVIDDCVYAGAIALAISVLFLGFMIYDRPFQPLIILVANGVMTFFQALTLILVLAGVNKDIASIVFIVGNSVGALLAVMPIIKFIVDLVRDRGESKPDDDALLQEMLFDVKSLGPATVKH